MYRLDAADVQRFAQNVLCAAGLDLEDARVIAGGLVSANLRGVDSHGVLRLVQYAETLAAGGVNARPTVRVVEQRGVTAIVDADGGYGYRPSILAMEVAITLARSHGAGVVGVRNSHHFGMAAFYTIPAAEAGMIGFITTTSTPHLAPPGGLKAVVGNNPVSFALPRKPPHPPVVLDMALSVAAFGRIRLAATEGRPIPLGWAYDASGHPTTDALEALRAAMLVPIGAHKGYGLSVVSEVLAGVLTGSPFGLDSSPHGRAAGGVGHFAAAIDPGHFLDLLQYQDGIERLVAQVKSVLPADGAPGVYVPGEPEFLTQDTREREGIPVSVELARELEALAFRLGVAPPGWR